MQVRIGSSRIPAQWLLVAVLWLVYLVAVWVLHTQVEEGSQDFEAYYDAAWAIPNHINPYHLPQLRLTDMPYVYPPLTAMLLVPMASVSSFEQAAFIWYCINIALLLASLALMTQYIQHPRLRLLLWLMPIFFTPTIQSLVHGQATVIMLFLSVAVWAALREDKPVLAGVLLALSVWIKVYPLVLVLYFLWKREMRVLAGVLLGGVIFGLLQVFTVGLPLVSYYFIEVLFGIATTSSAINAYLNSSLLGFSSKLFQESRFVIPLVENETLFKLMRYGLTAIVVAITIFVSSRPIAYARTSPRRRDLEYALVTVAALLLNARFWESGMMPFLLVYMLLLAGALERSDWRLLGFCLLSFLLIDAHRIVWLLWHEQPLPGLLLSLPFFGAALLWGLTAIEAEHERDTTSDLALAHPRPRLRTYFRLF